MIVAKTIIPKQYWILKNHDRKVGNIEASEQGFQVTVNGKVSRYKTLDMVQQRAKIDFDTPPPPVQESTTNEIHGYGTSSQPYNATWDLRRKLPIWTTSPRSKSWMAAGWYQLYYNRTWRTVFCPKVILLDRYKHRGPFHTQEEANQE